MDKNQIIPYQVKVSRRARRIRLTVQPVRKTDSLASPHLLNSAEELSKKQFSNGVACDSTVTLTLPFGTAIGVAEKFIESKLAWIKRAVEYFSAHPGVARARPVRGEYKRNKNQAIILAREKVKQWAEFYGVSYGRIAIRNQKTRWGSCSKKGNLNFNYRIVQLRPELLDYLIVHELCHLQEFNHSRNFWTLVAKAIPDYKKLRAELRKFGRI